MTGHLRVKQHEIGELEPCNATTGYPSASHEYVTQNALDRVLSVCSPSCSLVRRSTCVLADRRPLEKNNQPRVARLRPWLLIMQLWFGGCLRSEPSFKLRSPRPCALVPNRPILILAIQNSRNLELIHIICQFCSTHYLQKNIRRRSEAELSKRWKEQRWITRSERRRSRATTLICGGFALKLPLASCHSTRIATGQLSAPCTLTLLNMFKNSSSTPQT